MTNRQKTLFVITGLTIAAAAVFWQVRNFEFINYDDNRYVTENQHIFTGLKPGNIIWAFRSSHFFMWHPVTSLSHMLDCQIFGLSPGCHHLINLLLHIATTLLLFGILKTMTGRFWPSAFVAAVFALHPLNVESIAWVAERKTVLSGFFWMLTLFAYIRYVKLAKTSNYMLLIIVFSLALMSKPTTVTLPFVLLLLDYWPLERFGKINLSKLILEKIPLFALSAALCIITVVTQQSGDVLVLNKQLPFAIRLTNALVSYMTYIGKMIYPAGLAVFYPHPGFSLPVWKAISPFILLLVISAVVFYLRRQKPYLITGWFWFLGTLVPVIGLMQAGAQAMADRYVYVPLIGLFIIVAWGAADLLKKWKLQKFVLTISSIAVVLALAAASRIQTSYWQNSITLFDHALKVTSDNYIASYNLGFALLDQDKCDEAIKLFQYVLQIKPDHVDAYCNLGMAYGRLGRYEEAIKVSKQAIKIKPDCSNAYNNIAVANARLGRNQDAVEAYEKAIAIEPDNARMHFNIGITYGELDYTLKEIEAYKKAISLQPDFAEAYDNLGLAYDKLKRQQEAIEAYRRAVAIKPDWAEAYNNLANAYCKLGRYQEGIEAYKKAIAIKPDDARVQFNLGVTYLHAGDKVAAIKQYEILKKLDAGLADKFTGFIK